MSEEQAVSAATAYGYDDFLEEETEQEERTQQRIRELRKQFLDDPVLVLPLVKMKFSFNPNDVFTLGDDGSVYGTATINDEWGTLTVTRGVLVSWNTASYRISAPGSTDDRDGPGWTLKLNEDWKLLAGDRKGDFKLVQS